MSNCLIDFLKRGDCLNPCFTSVLVLRKLPLDTRKMLGVHPLSNGFLWNSGKQEVAYSELQLEPSIIASSEGSGEDSYQQIESSSIETKHQGIVSINAQIKITDRELNAIDAVISKLGGISVSGATNEEATINAAKKLETVFAEGGLRGLNPAGLVKATLETQELIALVGSSATNKYAKDLIKDQSSTLSFSAVDPQKEASGVLSNNRISTITLNSDSNSQTKWYDAGNNRLKDYDTIVEDIKDGCEAIFNSTGLRPNRLFVPHSIYEAFANLTTDMTKASYLQTLQVRFNLIIEENNSLTRYASSTAVLMHKREGGYGDFGVMNSTPNIQAKYDEAYHTTVVTITSLTAGCIVENPYIIKKFAGIM